MHIYKDAILRNKGLCIISGVPRWYFKVNDNESIPSVGAFPLNPGEMGKKKMI